LISPLIKGTSKVTFGLFEAHLQNDELWKAGKRIKIQIRPSKALAALLTYLESAVRYERRDPVWASNRKAIYIHAFTTGWRCGSSSKLHISY